jgi:serine phosphatase RsbU (regulator of sigma subunit)
VHKFEEVGIIQLYRDTVYIAFILTLTSYFVNKYHAFIVAGVYVLSIVFFSFTIDKSIIHKFLTIIFSISSYSIIIYYFVKKQEKTLEELNHINFQINQQNEELLQQQEEISLQKEILTEQAMVIIEKNKEVLDGIRFAKSIQESVLSKESDIEAYFKNYFVISRPKSMISGDFFWVKEWHDKIYMAVVDCTGHGVPGALVSMLANMYLGRAFIEIENPHPSQILNYINKAIAGELRLIESYHARVGMDIAIVCIDLQKMTMDYAGAFCPLYMIRRDNLIQYEGTKIMIGILTHNKSTQFKDQTINLMKGDRFYLFSDGVLDQFGQKTDKKFGYKRMRNALVDTNHGSLETQKELFIKKWLEWKGNRLQVDDVLLLGFEI